MYLYLSLSAAIDITAKDSSNDLGIFKFLWEKSFRYKETLSKFYSYSCS